LHSTVLYTKFSAVAVTSVSIMRIVCSIFFPARFDSLLAADGVCHYQSICRAADW